MRNKLIVAMTLATSLLTSWAASAEIVEVCNYCSEDQMKNKALSRIQGEGQYEINVLDMTNYNLKKFTITRIKDKEVGFIDRAVPGEASTDLKGAVVDLQSASNKVKQTISAPIGIEQLTPYIPGPNVTSAHGVATSKHNKALIKAALQKFLDNDFGSALKSVLTKLGSQVVGGIITIDTSITVQWPDGTTYDFKLGKFLLNISKNELIIQISALPESGRDNGTLITEGFEGLSLNSSHTGPDTLGRFLNNAKNSGVTIVRVGPGSGRLVLTGFKCNSAGTQCNAIYKLQP